MHAVTRLFAVGLCAAAAASAVHAQRTVQSSSPARPSASTQAAQSAPNPAGLTSPFPAGISSGSGARVSTDPIASSSAPLVPSSVLPGTGTGTTVGGGGVGVRPELGAPVAPATNVLGAGATVAGPAQYAGGAGGFSATDQARSFFFADANQDGELTRAEAARLSIRTMPFEEMDRNFDGVITRFEYQDTLR
ncbi:MAG TPA: hypothetical protein VNB23_08275 [Ramlibacter sp.]|nr:hypothetical protein [Ramlibacter sp.]